MFVGSILLHKVPEGGLEISQATLQEAQYIMHADAMGDGMGGWLTVDALVNKIASRSVSTCTATNADSWSPSHRVHGRSLPRLSASGVAKDTARLLRVSRSTTAAPSACSVITRVGSSALSFAITIALSAISVENRAA